MTSIVKCHLLDRELVDMTIDALDTIHPYSDETIIVRTTDSVTTPEFEDYLLKHDIGVVTAEKGFPNFVAVGMLVSQGNYVAVLNNDILMPPNWSKKLLDLFTDDNILMVHPKMLGWNDEFYKGREVKENIDPREGMFFSAFILRKPFFGSLGWDMDYDYSGYDDWDFYYRARKAGYDCLWTDIVQYKHKGGATMDKIGRDQYYKKNREIFISKHGIDPQAIDWYGI